MQIYGATKTAFNLPHETTKKGTKDKKQWFSRHLTLANNPSNNNLGRVFSSQSREERLKQSLAILWDGKTEVSLRRPQHYSLLSPVKSRRKIHKERILNT